MLLDNWTTAFLKLLEHLLLGNSNRNSRLESHTKILENQEGDRFKVNLFSNNIFLDN